MAIPNPNSQNDVASGSNTQNSSNSVMTKKHLREVEVDQNTPCF